MRVAVYARVSSEAQEARGTIGSQLEVLRARVATEGHELVAEFCDDGYSGARLDRPGLDALRDQAEAGTFDAVWCLSPDRLAHAYAYQVLVLDELEHFGVRVLFADAPTLDDDPQARLLTQVQGVIAEYERAKISERNRRGRLFRARTGEIVTWKVPYGYRRVPATPMVPHAWTPSSQKSPWSVASMTTTSTVASRSDTSCEPSTPSRSPPPPARPSGGTQRCAGSSQRGLRRSHLLQPDRDHPHQHRHQQRTAPRHQPAAATTRGVDRDPLPTHPGRCDLRGGPASQPRQLAVEST